MQRNTALGLQYGKEAMSLLEHRVLECNRNQDDAEPSAQPSGVELPPAIRPELLDPANWQEGLTTFARATNLAVALADAAGRLIGEYINPRPTWSLLHSKTPKSEVGGQKSEISFLTSDLRPLTSGGCPFSLAPLQPCHCVADALASGGVVVARDRAGLVHFAVPLVLGGHPLGALVAGQVFTRYPEQLPLEHIASQLLLSPGKVWESARLEHPVNQATLAVYADLLATLGQTFLQSCDQSLREAERLAEMTRLRDHAMAEATQRKRVEEALQETDRRKNEFLAMLSHELRNPLAPLLNAVQLLRLQQHENQLQRQAREVIERQVTQLTYFVNDLLEVSRITTGKIRLHQERLTVKGIVEHAIETARPLIEQRRHQLNVSLPPEPIWLHADAARLEQVVVNLLTNAAKYTDEGGHVWLTVELASGEASGGCQSPEKIGDRQPSGKLGGLTPPARLDEVLIRVRDTGVGIAPDLLPRIFDLFTQAERSLARSQGGLGIGLALVQRLTELHGGKVEVYSALGHGSEFVVRLPVAMTDAPQPSPPTKNETAEPTGPSLRVLVVDDNLDAAQTLATVLKSAGHQVRVAHTGSAALQVALDDRPNVVLLDIGLPEMDGYEVAKRIRQESVLQGVVLVAVTGYGQEADQQTSLNAGFDYHLVKPADFRNVQQILAIAAEKAK